jgi:cephalosporin hydroxylase
MVLLYMKITVEDNNDKKTVDLYSAEGLDILTDLYIKSSCHHRIMYEPTWLGIPIIQYAEDVVMLQELIWKIKPDVIIETGVAHGGTAILYSSILELLGAGRVIGIDIDIRKHNRLAINSHPLSKRITLIEGSSIDENIFNTVKKSIKENEKVLVTLDSNHSYEHVKNELEIYSTMVTPGSYLVAMDGAQAQVWDIPNGKREWEKDNPLRAIEDFVKKNKNFEIDEYYTRLRITSNPKGFLKKIG